MKKPKLYIDGDMLVYKLGYAAEEKVTWMDGTVSKAVDLSQVKRMVRRTIKGYLSLFGATEYELVVSGSGNYRMKFYPEYKANRVVLTKPMCYDGLRKWMCSLPEAVLVEGEEADDYLAQVLTDPSRQKNAVVISADKDFYTVPGHVYNISNSRLFNIKLQQAFSFLWFQAMAGDRVDGYYGVRWLGVAKSKRLLIAACGQPTLRASYLFLKREVTKRGKDRPEKQALWNDFRLCADLAALRWTGEVGTRGIALRRLWAFRFEQLEFFLPYYDIHQNLKHGQEVPHGKA